MMFLTMRSEGIIYFKVYVLPSYMIRNLGPGDQISIAFALWSPL